MNYYTMSLENLKKAADELGVAYTEDVTKANLAKALTDKAKESTPPTPPAPTRKSKAFYYWFKTNVYVSHTDHLTRGLYKFDHEIERVKNLPRHEMEVFEGEIPERMLYKIADWAGVTVDMYEGNTRTTKSDAELLEVLLKN